MEETKEFFEKFKYCPACGSEQFVKNNEKSKRCEQCGFVYYYNASAASVAFIRNEDGDLLVCRRAFEPAKGTLDLPGGFIDDEESAEEGVFREVYEETGLKIDKFQYIFSIPNEYPYSGLKVLTLDIFFEAVVPNGSKIHANDDVEECFFIPVRELNPELFGLKSIKKAVKAFIRKYEGERKEGGIA